MNVALWTWTRLGSDAGDTEADFRNMYICVFKKVAKVWPLLKHINYLLYQQQHCLEIVTDFHRDSGNKVKSCDQFSCTQSVKYYFVSCEHCYNCTR